MRSETRCNSQIIQPSAHRYGRPSLGSLILIACWLLLASSSAAADVQPEILKLIRSARAQIGETVAYDGSYARLAFPGGDVPLRRGVCTDVVVRAYRHLGIDLQKLVHEDMRAHFGEYPSKRIWGLSKPDSNIDHRRVPNLQKFFQRMGKSFGTDLQRFPPQPGHLLTWELPGGLPHIGIVSDRKTQNNSQFLVIHNIGGGTQEEAVIDNFPLTGHYRYFPHEVR